MEPLAESAPDLLEKFSDAVGKNPERSGFYVNLIIMARSLEQIIYLIESITKDIIYVAEAKISGTRAIVFQLRTSCRVILST